MVIGESLFPQIPPVHISGDARWEKNTPVVVKKVHKRLYFLINLRKTNIRKELLLSVYRCAFEVEVWYDSCIAEDKKPYITSSRQLRKLVILSFPY